MENGEKKLLSSKQRLAVLKDLELEKLSVELRQGIESAIELAELTGEEVPLEPNTFGMLNFHTIEEGSKEFVGFLSSIIWKAFEVPRGSKMMEAMVSQTWEEAPTGGAVPGQIRKRRFKTRSDNVFLNELLYADNQKRFTVSVESA